jgi:ribosomal protein S18
MKGFNDWVQLLQQFCSQNGRLPSSTAASSSDEGRLYTWCTNQRVERRQQQLSAEQQQALEKAIPDWNWGHDTGKKYVSFEDQLALLKQFLQETGRLPQRKEKLNGANIGAWCSYWRRKQELKADQVLQLDLVPDWKWKLR